MEKYSFHRVNLGQNKEEHYEEERKKGLAVAMTLAVTMTSVPTAFATSNLDKSGCDSDTDCKRTGAVNRGMDSG